LARKAVAATLASVLLLTALVVADATLMTAQDNLASSAQTAHTEGRELLLEESLTGSTSLQLLAQVQGFLSSSPADCDSIPQYISSISASSSVSGEDEGIAYVANESATGAPTALLQGAPGGDLAIASPFSGFLPGGLNLVAASSVKEVGGGGSVSLERRETHALNLPISPGTASSLCASALGSLAAALSQSSCNATLAQAAFADVMPRLEEEASALGFFLTAGWGLDGPACSATYWVMLVELGVMGVTGGFDWTVLGSGATA